MRVAIDAAAVTERAASRSISEAGLKHLPETLGWNPLRLIGARLRDFLEESFPQGSLFYPFFAIDRETGASKPANFFYWLPCHYLRFKPNPKRSSDQAMTPHVWGALGRQDTVWEMYHNKAFQAFVEELPFWTPSPNFNQCVFRADVYHSIKAASFTGFEEAAADNYLRHTPEQCVGYVHFARGCLW